MDEYIVFKMSFADVEKYRSDIIGLLQQSFLKSFPYAEISEDYYQKRVDQLKSYITEDKATIYAVSCDERLKGFIWFFIKNDFNSNTIHIVHFVVDKRYRGRGIGSILLSKVDEYAKKNKINQIELLVSKDNRKAVRFYLDRNFEIERYVMKRKLCDNGE